MMLRFASAVLLCSVVACAGMARGLGTLPPGYGVSPEMLQKSGCDQQEFQGKVEEYKQQIRAGEGTGESLVPRVGTDVCDLLAMVGAPSRQDIVQTEGGTRLNWWYQTGMSGTMSGTKQHLVELAEHEGRVRVLAVVW